MKPLCIIIIVLLTTLRVCYGQFSTSGGNTTTTDNVGIGTTTPATLFEVKPATNQRILFAPNTNGWFSAAPGIIALNDAGGYISLGLWASSYAFGGGDAFIASKVGIGNASPVSTLQVSPWSSLSSGTSSFLASTPTIAQTSTAGYRALWISPYESTTGTGSNLLIDAGTNSAGNGSGTHTSLFSVKNNGAVVASGSTTADAFTATNTGFRSASGATNSNFITASVGRGTISSAAALFGGASTVNYRLLNRGSNTSLPVANSGYATYVIGNEAVTIASSGTHGLFAQQVIKPLLINPDTGALTNSATLYLEDATSGAQNNYNLWAAGSGLNRLDGNVAIGTLAVPTGYNVAINGNTIATSVTVKQYSAWPDYVFRPTYKLKPLNKLKADIDRNRHLPDMPSAKDVKKKGVNIGEMNQLLLKKIEELTLYMIAQQQQIDALKSKLKAGGSK